MQLCLLITDGWLEVRKAAYLLVQRSKERRNKREREREREEKEGKAQYRDCTDKFQLGTACHKRKKENGKINKETSFIHV